MGPPSYMQSVVDRIVVMRRIPVTCSHTGYASLCTNKNAFRKHTDFSSALWTYISVTLQYTLFMSCFYSGQYLFLIHLYPSVKNTLITADLRGGADKSLAQPTSPCRRTESIVSLERGVFSCAELQVFSCYRGWKETCQATRAISTTSRSKLPSIFFSCRARRRRKFT